MCSYLLCSYLLCSYSFFSYSVCTVVTQCVVTQCKGFSVGDNNSCWIVNCWNNCFYWALLNNLSNITWNTWAFFHLPRLLSCISISISISTANIKQELCWKDVFFKVQKILMLWADVWADMNNRVEQHIKRSVSPAHCSLIQLIMANVAQKVYNQGACCSLKGCKLCFLNVRS